MWFKRKTPKHIEISSWIVSSEPPVQAPVGTVLGIKADDKLPETMQLQILTDDGSVELASSTMWGGETDEDVRQEFRELIHEYETEQSVVELVRTREGEYDQWPPQ